MTKYIQCDKINTVLVLLLPACVHYVVGYRLYICITLFCICTMELVIAYTLVSTCFV